MKIQEQLIRAGWPVRADELRACMGADLVGKRIVTPPLGDYPGGEAVVLDLGTDPAAPEIVMNVHLDDWGDIGVFEFETVRLRPV